MQVDSEAGTEQCIMKGNVNGLVPIPPFTVVRGGQHFVPSFWIEEAALQGIVRFQTIVELWKVPLRIEGERM